MNRGNHDGWFAAELERIEAGLGRRVNADPERLESGLAQLVLAVIELLREAMEREAIRRIDAGDFDAEEIERLGSTFLALARRMDELGSQFGLRDEDLNLNLGPLSELLWAGDDRPGNGIALRGDDGAQIPGSRKAQTT